MTYEAEYRPLRSTSWTEALYEIEHLLFELIDAIDAYLVITVERFDDVFVQFHSCGIGVITAEASATQRCGSSCGPRHLLPPQDSARMTALGWQTPNLDPLKIAVFGAGHPNFYKTWSTSSGWPPALFSDLTVRTLHDRLVFAPIGLRCPGRPARFRSTSGLHVSWRPCLAKAKSAGSMMRAPDR